jgi:hypothetical protein
VHSRGHLVLYVRGVPSYTCRSESGDAWFTAQIDGHPKPGQPINIGLRSYLIIDVRMGSDFPPLDPSAPVLIVRSAYSRKTSDTETD